MRSTLENNMKRGNAAFTLIEMAVVLLIAGVVIWRHRSNIQRLLHGNEQRFGQE